MTDREKQTSEERERQADSEGIRGFQGSERMNEITNQQKQTQSN